MLEQNGHYFWTQHPEISQTSIGLIYSLISKYDARLRLLTLD